MYHGKYIKKILIAIACIVFGNFIIKNFPSTHELKTIIYQFSAIEIATLICISIVTSINLVTKNKFLLVSMNVHTSFKKLILIYFSASIAHYTAPGKAGYPVNAYLLKHIAGVPYTKSSIFLLTDFTLSVFFTVMIAFIGLTIIYRNIFILWGISIILILAAILIISIVLFINHQQKLLSVKSKVQNVISLLRIFTLSHVLVLFCFYIINLLLGGLFLYLLILFTHGNVPFWKVVVADATSFLFGAISMIPMGLGVQDMSLAYFLNTLGISHSNVVAIIANQRVITIGLTYFFGLISTGILGIHKVKKVS